MITVYTSQKNGNIVPNKHDMGWDWVLESGHLVIRSRSGDPIVTYAPGSWHRVEDNDPIEADSAEVSA